MNQQKINILLNKYAIQVFRLRCVQDREFKSIKLIQSAGSIENKIDAIKHKMDLIRGLA